MEKHNGRYELFGSPITRRQSRAVDRWQRMFTRRYNYDPKETYTLGIRDNAYLGDIWGLKDIIRVDANGDPLLRPGDSSAANLRPASEALTRREA